MDSPTRRRRSSESDAEEDWQANIDVFIAQGCQHIVTVGFFLGGVTAINAMEHPEITWTMVDNILTDENFVPLNLENVRELVYQTDQAAFAAGYLAAGVTKTGILGTYGGANIPTVSIFMDGFTRGAAHYNEVKGTDVVVLGWDVEAQDGVFTGSFTDFVLARDTADSLFQEGVDIIIPVGGQINLPAGDAINGGGLDAALIGVDARCVLRHGRPVRRSLADHRGEEHPGPGGPVGRAAGRRHLVGRVLQG